MHSWRSFLFSAFLLAPAVRGVQFSHIGSSPSSNASVTFNWTREPKDPTTWFLSSITSMGDHFVNDLEIQHVQMSSGKTGNITIPLMTSRSLNLTLGTFTLGWQKSHTFKFSGDLFGKLTTFEVVNSTRSVTPGILPQPVKKMLTGPASKTNRTPVIVGAIVGTVAFLLALAVLLLFYRRYQHRKRAALLLREHQFYKTTGPEFPSYYSDERRDSNISWYSTKDLPANAEISNALSTRAAAARMTSFDKDLVAIPTFPRNSVVSNRSLHTEITEFDPERDRRRQLERGIARLHGKMNKLQSTTDRDTPEGIQDEAKLIELMCAMERLKRRLDQEG